MKAKFNCKIEEGIFIISFLGDLRGEDCGPEVIEAVNSQINDGIKKAAIDLTDVRYMNSSGIGLLITIRTKFLNKDGEIVLINPSEHVKKLLIVTKLDAIFTIVDSWEVALNSLNS